MTRMSEDDELAAGFHDLLSQDKLAALTDIALLALLDGSDDGSARRRQLEREWARRGSVQVAKPAQAKPHHASQEAARPPDQSRDWTDKPLGKIAVPVIGAVLVLLVGYLHRTHL